MCDAGQRLWAAGTMPSASPCRSKVGGRDAEVRPAVMPGDDRVAALGRVGVQDATVAGRAPATYGDSNS
jgi:hypothetical protein